VRYRRGSCREQVPTEQSDFGMSKWHETTDTRIHLTDSHWNRLAAELGKDNPADRAQIGMMRAHALIIQDSEKRAARFYRPASKDLNAVAGCAKKLAAALRALKMPPAGWAWQTEFCMELDEMAAAAKSGDHAKEKSRPQTVRDQLLDGLFDLWKRNGRPIGTGAAGPLVRFLIAGCDAIFLLNPGGAREYVRGRIDSKRKYRKRNKRIGGGRSISKR
jgi:hypothetical protein